MLSWGSPPDRDPLSVRAHKSHSESMLFSSLDRIIYSVRPIKSILKSL